MNEFATPDMDALLARAARSVFRLRVLEAILGVVLLLFAWPIFASEGARAITKGGVALLRIVEALSLVVAGVVNLWLAYRLDRGRARVAEVHRRLSALGIAAGLLTLILFFGDAMNQGQVKVLFGGWTGAVPSYLGWLLVPVLGVPLHALAVLGSHDVEMYLGLTLTDPRQLLREAGLPSMEAEEPPSTSSPTQGPPRPAPTAPRPVAPLARRVPRPAVPATWDPRQAPVAAPSTLLTVLKTALVTLAMVAVVLVLLTLAAIAALNAFCNGLQHLNWGHC